MRIFLDIWLPFDKFKTINKIKKINCPVKIIHGEKDELIKLSHAKDIYKNLNNKIFTPQWIQYGTHNLGIDYNYFIEIINY